MKFFVPILLYLIIPCAIAMDQKGKPTGRKDPRGANNELSNSSDEGYSASGGQSASGHHPRVPLRSSSSGQLGRNPYTLVSPRKRHPAGSHRNKGSSKPRRTSAPQRRETLTGYNNVVGGPHLLTFSNPDPSSSAAATAHGSLLPPTGSCGLASLHPQPNLFNQQRSSDVKRFCEASASFSQSQGAGESSLGDIFQRFQNLNLSPRGSPGSRAHQNSSQEFETSSENPRAISRGLAALIRQLHEGYFDPVSFSDLPMRLHRTSVRLLERITVYLRAIKISSEDFLGLQRIDSDLFVLSSSRIPNTISAIRQALQQHETNPDFDLPERMRSILQEIMPDLFSIVDQINSAI